MSEPRYTTVYSLLLPVLLALFVLTGCATAPGYRVSHFEEGKVVVDNKLYRYDVVILPDGVVHRVTGTESHMIYLKDVDEYIKLPGIRTLVVGTGTEGKVELDFDLEDRLQEMGIEVKRMPTEDAVRMMNRSPKEGVVAILHLNC